jgi:hypothetical protein
LSCFVKAKLRQKKEKPAKAFLCCFDGKVLAGYIGVKLIGKRILGTKARREFETLLSPPFLLAD